MRFAFIDAWKEEWSVEFLCKVMQVTSRGFRAWRVRPMSQRQRDDMVILAHIREQHRLSLVSYGRPRMTEELQEEGLNVGHRRVGRLMRENGIKIIRTQKYKATTDSNHTFNIAPNLLDQDFSATGPNQKWAGDISYIWTSEGWLYLAVILDLYFPPIGLKPPTSVGKEFNRAPQALKNTEPFDFSRRRFSLAASSDGQSATA